MKPVFLIVVAVSTMLCANAVGQTPEKESVLKTAKNQIVNFTKDIPDHALEDYGFHNKQEFEKITFADPVPVYTLKDSSVVFTFTWRVPLVIGKETRSLLTVVYENGIYQAVDFGATELAKAYATGKTPNTIGLLRVYELRKDYLMEKPEKENQTLIELEYSK